MNEMIKSLYIILIMGIVISKIDYYCLFVFLFGFDMLVSVNNIKFMMYGVKIRVRVIFIFGLVMEGIYRLLYFIKIVLVIYFVFNFLKYCSLF